MLLVKKKLKPKQNDIERSALLWKIRFQGF